MKISFIDINRDDNVGSYRIWVRDLSRSLCETGVESKILSGQENLVDFFKDSIDAIILGKSSYGFAPHIKNLAPGVKVGAINIPAGHKDPSIDFVIVGSPEEYISISNYKNVFIYPLIERKFENVELKSHKDVDVMKFCFHGHWPHIPKFFPYVTPALEAYHDNIKPSELHIITGEDTSPFGDKFIPSNLPVFFHNYKNIDFTKTVLDFDIGLVPNVTSIENISKDISSFQNTDLGLYETDFNIRFKNKTNGGRAYVFYQHGIPVIHDISPSSFDFMGRTGIYCCGHDSKSYLREMVRLTDASFRERVSHKNIEVFRRDFNPVNHASYLVQFIREV